MRGLLALLAVALPAAAQAVMVVEITPTPAGGTHLSMRFDDVTQPDSRGDWVELNPPGHLIHGGSSHRDSRRFADTFESQIVADGFSTTTQYVRFGNGVASEQLFLFLHDYVPTGVQLSFAVDAEYEPANLAFSQFLPGVYSAWSPRYGGGLFVVDPLGSTVAGDMNSDGLVDGQDYTAWRTAYGASVTPGLGPDLNADGVVDSADYTVWRDAMHNQPEGLGSQAPAPGARQLIALLLPALAARQRRRLTIPS